MKFIDRILGFLVHNFFKTLAVLIFNCLYRTVYINGGNIPKKGGCLVMPNHSSFWDPPLVGCVTYRRQFKFMARDTLFRFPVWGTLLRYMGAFPVRRGAVDRKSWDALVQKVNEGEVVTFFPEGTRTLDGEIQKGKPGTGMLVHRARTKVIPVYMHGTYGAWPKGRKFPRFFRRLTVIYGEPIDFSGYFEKEGTKELYVEITEKIIDRIKELKKARLESVGAGKK